MLDKSSYEELFHDNNDTDLLLFRLLEIKL
jgi:hypothetical protein